MTDWQPISTAPKDGTQILAIFADENDHTIIHWMDAGYGDDDGRWCQSLPGLGADCGYFDAAFTHWMPLPPPPKQETE